MTWDDALPPAVQRAKDYVAIFLGVGDDWRDCVPADGRIDREGVLHLDGLRLWPSGIDRWSAEDADGNRWTWKRAQW